MATPNFYSAVYAIIKNEKWKILFWRRKNTWFKDWFFQLPAWHIEDKELVKESCIREMKEELDIDMLKDDLKVVHICHRVKKDRVYFDIYLEVKKYFWEIKINETDKCSELKFVDINNLPIDDFVNYDIDCVKKANSGEYFSEVNFEL